MSSDRRLKVMILMGIDVSRRLGRVPDRLIRFYLTSGKIEPMVGRATEQKNR